MGHVHIGAPKPKQTGGPMSGRRRPDHNDLDEQLTEYLAGETPEAQIEAARLDAQTEEMLSRDAAYRARIINQRNYNRAVRAWEERLNERKAELMIDGVDERTASQQAVYELCDALPMTERFGAY